MTRLNISPDQVAEEAGKLLDARVNVVREVAQKAQARAEAQQALTEAESAYAATWTTATKTGWSERELTSIGLDKPGAPSRKRRARSSAPNGAGADAREQANSTDHAPNAS